MINTINPTTTTGINMDKFYIPISAEEIKYKKKQLVKTIARESLEDAISYTIILSALLVPLLALALVMLIQNGHSIIMATLQVLLAIPVLLAVSFVIWFTANLFTRNKSIIKAQYDYDGLREELGELFGLVIAASNLYDDDIYALHSGKKPFCLVKNVPSPQKAINSRTITFTVTKIDGLLVAE